jgi:hypothetical protein
MVWVKGAYKILLDLLTNKKFKSAFSVISEVGAVTSCGWPFLLPNKN